MGVTRNSEQRLVFCEAHDFGRRAATSELTHTEIFGPVLSLIHTDNMDEAIAFLERNPYGNQASLFTSSGQRRELRYEAPAGNIGINIGVGRSHGVFPVQWLEGQLLRHHTRTGPRLVEFYTEKKVVVERWAERAPRKF